MNRKRILLVDDSSTILMMEKFILRNGPYDLVTASDGEEGVRKATEHLPDLILLDVIMPRMGGFEACRLIRDTAETKSIPIIMVTTRGEAAKCRSRLGQRLHRLRHQAGQLDRTAGEGPQLPGRRTLGGDGVSADEKNRFYVTVVRDELQQYTQFWRRVCKRGYERRTTPSAISRVKRGELVGCTVASPAAARPINDSNQARQNNAEP